jgi:cytochrome c oxidase assembly protein subunit 23
MPTTPIKNGEEVKKRIARDINPGSGLTHNHGQPKQAPYKSKESSTNTAKFLTNCASEHGESLKCIERNYQDRSACQPFFDAYKQCRKDENDKRKETNAKATGGSSGWFW